MTERISLKYVMPFFGAWPRGLGSADRSPSPDVNLSDLLWGRVFFAILCILKHRKYLSCPAGTGDFQTLYGQAERARRQGAAR